MSNRNLGYLTIMQCRRQQNSHRLIPLTPTALLVCCAATLSFAAEPDNGEMARQFRATVGPFLKTYCQSCHGPEQPKAKLDLTRYASLAEVAKNHATWQLVLERLEAKEMPPEEAKRQPGAAERQVVVQWIRDFRAAEAKRNV